MSNPVVENVRRSLGRTAQSPLGVRPAIFPPRYPESVDAEIERFLNEVKLLSGAGQRLAPGEVRNALKVLVAECSVR